MKKFEFELEDVLKYRKFEQQQAEMELGKAVAAEREIQSKLDALAVQQVSVERQMKGSIDFSRIADASRFYAFVEQQKEFLLKKMAEANLVTEQKRVILKEIMQKTDALEKLKEQQLEEYKEASDREEEDIIDDIVTGRFRFKK